MSKSQPYSLILSIMVFAISFPLFSQEWNPRISLQAGWMGGEEGFNNYQISAGYVPSSWVVPSVHLYVTFDKYDYQHYGTTEDFHKILVTGILPAIKLFRFLVIGYGYLTGTEHRLYLAGMQDTLEFYNRKYSRWTTFSAIDIDLYVYREYYFTFGLYMRQPSFYIAIGLSKRL